MELMYSILFERPIVKAGTHKVQVNIKIGLGSFSLPGAEAMKYASPIVICGVGWLSQRLLGVSGVSSVPYRFIESFPYVSPFRSGRLRPLGCFPWICTAASPSQLRRPLPVPLVESSGYFAAADVFERSGRGRF